MSCDGYTKTALMGNWYEERLALSQPARDDKDFRSLRQKEAEVSYISGGTLHALERTKRAHPWNTTAVIVDDGYKEWRTTHRTSFDPLYGSNYKAYGESRPVCKSIQPQREFPENQTSMQTSPGKKFTMVNQSTLQKYSTDVPRDVTQNVSDFGSTFKKHNQEHNRLYSLTSYEKAFDRPSHVSAQEVIQKEGQKLGQFAGYEQRPEHHMGIKMTSPLTSEVFKTEKDPQQNTRVQRAWLPYVENTISVVERNIINNEQINTSTGFRGTDKMANYRVNNSQMHGYDIATSLPLGEGEAAVKDKYKEPGTYRRIRTDITFTRNQPILRK